MTLGVRWGGLAGPDHLPTTGPRQTPRTRRPRPRAASPAGAGRLLPPQSRLQYVRPGRSLEQPPPSLDRPADPPAWRNTGRHPPPHPAEGGCGGPPPHRRGWPPPPTPGTTGPGRPPVL